MTSYDIQNWSGYCGQLRSIFDEYSRAISELETVVLSVPTDRYTIETELSDENFPDIRGIMDHIVGAAHAYADYLRDAINQTDSCPQEHVYNLETPEDAMKSVLEAFNLTVDALASVKDYSEDQLAGIKFSVRWGQDYDAEQMLEHAIVHILRHRRQLERWIASP